MIMRVLKAVSLATLTTLGVCCLLLLTSTIGMFTTITNSGGIGAYARVSESPGIVFGLIYPLALWYFWRRASVSSEPLS